MKAKNDSAKVGALRTVLEALEIHRDSVQTKDAPRRGFEYICKKDDLMYFRKRK